MSDQKREIEDLRQELHRIDGQILAALEKRAKTSRRVAELRKGQPAQLPLQDKAQIAALIARASGDMPPADLRVIFAAVYASCLALELPVRVSYLGPAGGAGHQASRIRFGEGAEFVPIDTTAGVLDEITRGRAEFAVVPIETLTDGPVQATITALTATELKIVGELEVAADLHLMNRTGNEADVEKVYATAADHVRAQKYLTQKRFSVLDVKTPALACELAKDDHGAGAIGTEILATQMGLEIAHRSIADDVAERVRYAIVGARPSPRTGDDATACVFSVNDAPGALLDVLKQFSERGINLKRIQSRPAPDEQWTYLFFVELTGHATDRTLVSAFEEVKRSTRFFKVLGSYPAIG